MIACNTTTPTGLPSLPGSLPRDEAAEVRQLVRYEAMFNVLDDLYPLEGLKEIAALINSRRKYLARLSGWRLAVQVSDNVVLLGGDQHGHKSEESDTLPLWDAFYWTRQRPELIKHGEASHGLTTPAELADPASHEILVLPTRSADGAIAVLSVASGDSGFNSLDRKFIRLLARQLSRHLSHLLMRRRMTRILQLHAYRDFLTGALNRQSILDHLKTQLALSKRMNLPLSVMIADVDWFKRINDTYGHPGGDDVLRGLTERFQQCVRESDAFGRYGGEEFLFVVYPCTREQTAKIAERIRSAVEAKPFTLHAPGPGSVATTISLGYASTENQTSLSADDLIALADKALYLSKSKGRNCVSASPQ